MEKNDKGQMISVRLSDETFGKLKVYAESHGETMSDVARRAIEGFLTAPVPLPSPVPAPPSGEVLELRLRLEALERAHGETRQYIWQIAYLLNNTQKMVNQILAVLMPVYPLLPVAPAPVFPWPSWREGTSMVPEGDSGAS